MATIQATEKRLAVATSWALFASFGLCFILSGFGAQQWLYGLAGFALIVAGFISHVIINVVFKKGFSEGEIVTGFIAFGVSLVCFILACLLDPALGPTDVAMGIGGFAAIVACFLVYLITKFGLRGAFSQFHRKGEKSVVG